MNEPFEIKLQEEFLFMKQTHDHKDRSIYRAYGLECSSGWYHILRDCCQAITDEYDKAGIPVDFIPEQIKEKFGTLRFYYDYEDAPVAIHAVDSLNSGSSLRFMPADNGNDDEKTVLRQKIAKIVRDAEIKSASTCEFCGKQGTLRRDLPWIKTLCEKCYAKMRKKL